LKKAYELVRKNGGVCIADEVIICFCHINDYLRNNMHWHKHTAYKDECIYFACSQLSLVSDTTEGG
jgi:hypothetical protein